ncbi:MAG TPA: GAF domain-containing protein, partial [Allocoleopsis sp.]
MDCGQYIVLLVSASAKERDACRQFLQQDGQATYQIQAVDCDEAALCYCEQMLPDVIVLSNPVSDLDRLAWLEMLNGLGERLVPIVVLLESADQAIALQLVQCGVQDFFLKSELTAEKLCRAVKAAILRSHLQRQIEKQREQQRLVGAIALRIRQSLNLQTVLNATVAEVRQFLQADRVLVYQLNPNLSGVIQAEAVVEGYSSSLQVQIEDVCFQQRGVQRYLDGRPWIVNDIYQAGLTKCHLQMLEQFQVKANLVVPILLSDRPSSVLWGLLVAHQCSAPRVWSADDLELLDQLAVQIAIAIQQAELYQQVMQDVAVRKQSEMSLQQVNQELEVRVERQTEELRSSEA